MKSNRSRLINLLLPRLEDVFFIALFLAVVGFGPRLMNVDGDLGRHITIGEYILTTRIIPTRDIFSHTMTGQPLTPHEWLAQVILSLIYRLGGLNGVVWFCALLIAVTFTLMYRQALQRSGVILVALGMAILGAATASLHWLARPHIFTILLVVLWVAELERIRGGELTTWWRLPILMLLWVNLHGAFIAGFVIWGIYLIGGFLDQIALKAEMGSSSGVENQVVSLGSAGNRFRPGGKRTTLYLVYAGALSLLVTLINPSGTHLWTTSIGYIRNRYLVDHTAEYLSPNFHELSTWPFLLMLVISIMLLGLRRKRLSYTDLFLLGAWSAMGLYSTRNIPLYAVLAVPVLAEALAAEVKTISFLKGLQGLQDRLLVVERSLVGLVWPLIFVILIALALSGGATLDFQGQGNQFLPDVFPVEAVDWLKLNPPEGEGFNYFTWGGYQLYRWWPEKRVFIDGQTDFYGEAFTRQYHQVISLAEGWEAVLEDYQVAWVLMPPEEALIQALRASEAWREAYADDTAVVMVRTGD
jgi:hypothetical protein